MKIIRTPQALAPYLQCRSCGAISRWAKLGHILVEPVLTVMIRTGCEKAGHLAIKAFDECPNLTDSGVLWSSTARRSFLMGRQLASACFAEAI